MAVLSSLRNRIFLASALVSVLSVAFAIRFVTVRAAAEAEAELRRDLERAASLAEQQHAARHETLLQMARLLADLPRLKAAVETGDPPTVAPLAADYQGRVRSDLLFVSDRGGALLASVGGAGAARPGDVFSALEGRETTAFEATSEGVLELVTVPIAIGEPPEILGALGLGFLLDRGLAERLKRLTESEVAFAIGGHVRAATLPEASTAVLRAALAGTGVVPLSLAGDDYLALARPLAPGADAPMAIVLRSRTERLRFLAPLRNALLLAALVAVALAVLLSYGVARTVTRPLSALTTAMREMSRTGDLTRKIPSRRGWDDEDAGLLANTFNALTDSIARFQREAALRERLSSLGRLSTVIAHEVRNPLMGIKASLAALRRDRVSAETAREAAQDIDQEVARLNRIVGDVLDFARPLRLDYARCDLNALCQDALAAALAGEPAVPSRVVLDPRVGEIATDAERLRTALVNVLANAREAGLAGDAGAVELCTELTGGGRVAIVVRDQGRGIPEPDLPHVFEPYYTTKRSGTGLGLAIAKNVVEALRGSIAARNREGGGVEVRIELPVDAPREDAG